MPEPTVQLTLKQPGAPPANLTLTTTSITLGRAHECTVPIADRFLSRRHAELTFADDQWSVRDCGSANGTTLNGVRLTAPAVLQPGDRIGLGDTEVIFHAAAPTRLLTIEQSAPHAMSMVIPLREIEPARDSERTGVINALALELIEDRPMAELFDFVLDSIVRLLQPSRAALAVFGKDRSKFANVTLRHLDPADHSDLTISRTMLAEVAEKRNVVSFIDTADDSKLARAESIVAQQIRSAVCAPLLANDVVLGVLYLDFMAAQRAVTHDDLRLIAQVSRFAAVKLETTRLRVEAEDKARLDEELRIAYTIQSKLLPATLPVIDGYVFAGTNKPCRTVSGDYYDVLVRPDGKLYFVIADVSGKGITAALVMTGLATAFEIFTRNDPTPAELVAELNRTLAPRTAPTKFVTLVAGLLDPTTGEVSFTNAGHVSPLLVSADGVQPLEKTDMVVGLFAGAAYRTQQLTLGAGDSLVMFTDGVSEAENEREDQLGVEPVAALLSTMHGTPAPRLLDTIEEEVRRFCGAAALTDDVTMFALTRLAEDQTASSS